MSDTIYCSNWRIFTSKNMTGGDLLIISALTVTLLMTWICVALCALCQNK